MIHQNDCHRLFVMSVCCVDDDDSFVCVYHLHHQHHHRRQHQQQQPQHHHTVIITVDAIVIGRCNDHITTSREKIAAYADNQLQVKGGILIGIWDEAELAAIRKRIDERAKL